MFQLQVHKFENHWNYRCSEAGEMDELVLNIIEVGIPNLKTALITVVREIAINGKLFNIFSSRSHIVSNTHSLKCI